MKRSSEIRRRSSIAAISLRGAELAPAFAADDHLGRRGGRCRPAGGSARLPRMRRCASSPSPSMSKQSRETKCRSRSTACAGADQAAGAAPRDHALLAHREAAADRAVVGKLVGLRVLRPAVEHDARRSAGSRRRRAGRSTVSPTRTSLRAISSSLCRVARCTTTPPTVIGSSIATGVSVPCRPTWIEMSSQHGLRLLRREFMRERPARRPADHAEPVLQAEVVDLVDDAVDVVGQFGARSARSRDSRRAPRRRRGTGASAG